MLHSYTLNLYSQWQGIDRSSFSLRKRAVTKKHKVERLYVEFNREHCLSLLTPHKGMVCIERFKERIENVLQHHHFHSDEERAITLHQYI